MVDAQDPLNHPTNYTRAHKPVMTFSVAAPALPIKDKIKVLAPAMMTPFAITTRAPRFLAVLALLLVNRAIVLARQSIRRLVCHLKMHDSSRDTDTRATRSMELVPAVQVLMAVRAGVTRAMEAMALLVGMEGATTVATTVVVDGPIMDTEVSFPTDGISRLSIPLTTLLQLERSSGLGKKETCQGWQMRACSSHS